MKELSVQEIQKAELKIMVKFDEICRSHNLKYFLSFGSLIGAIRHKGFIPWDDDIDIIMPRPDYEKFLDLCRKDPSIISPFVCGNYFLNKKFVYPITRLCDPSYIVEYDSSKAGEFGLFIDIYPFDGCGNSYEEALKIHSSFRNDVSVISSASKKKFQKSPGNKLRTLVKYMIYGYTNLFGVGFFINRVNERSKRKNFYEYKFVGCTNWCFDTKNLVERKYFDNQVEVQFEGHSFYAPKDYHELLTKMYGDYMQLPPIEERRGHHNYRAYKKN